MQCAFEASTDANGGMCDWRDCCCYSCHTCPSQNVAEGGGISDGPEGRTELRQLRPLPGACLLHADRRRGHADGILPLLFQEIVGIAGAAESHVTYRIDMPQASSCR